MKYINLYFILFAIPYNSYAKLYNTAVKINNQGTKNEVIHYEKDNLKWSISFIVDNIEKKIDIRNKEKVNTKYGFSCNKISKEIEQPNGESKGKIGKLAQCKYSQGNEKFSLFTLCNVKNKTNEIKKKVNTAVDSQHLQIYIKCNVEGERIIGEKKYHKFKKHNWSISGSDRYSGYRVHFLDISKEDKKISINKKFNRANIAFDCSGVDKEYSLSSDLLPKGNRTLSAACRFSKKEKFYQCLELNQRPYSCVELEQEKFELKNVCSQNISKLILYKNHTIELSCD